jgi:hypothetical protein
MRGRVCNLQCNHSMVRVAQNPKPYFTVSSETPLTWRARFPYLYPPGTGWPNYTPGPFLVLVIQSQHGPHRERLFHHCRYVSIEPVLSNSCCTVACSHSRYFAVGRHVTMWWQLSLSVTIYLSPPLLTEHTAASLNAAPWLHVRFARTGQRQLRDK